MGVKICHNTFFCGPKAVSYHWSRVPVLHMLDESFFAAKCCSLELRSRDDSS